jgi:hypothetical protein
MVMDPAVPSNAAGGNAAGKRSMRKASLLGKHTHRTPSGRQVHIFTRDGRYLARGRYERHWFGATLGRDEAIAEIALHKLLAQLEDDAYVRPSEANGRILPRQSAGRLTLRQVISDYLDEKRRLKGAKTASTYRGRLAHVLEFAEIPENVRQWPLARDINRDFALSLRSHLFASRTTANGRPGGRQKAMSPRQIYNVMEAFRSALNWARSPAISKLPLDWRCPLTDDVVGSRPRKDPLRAVKLPLASLGPLISKLDRWQLCHLGLLCVLPPRPDEFAGILVGDVDFQARRIGFGTRLGGNDFNKGRQSFVVPFPIEIEPLLHSLVGGRTEGPLLRNKGEFARPDRSKFGDMAELGHDFDVYLSGRGAEVHSEQDRKMAFRAFLAIRGGISPDRLAKEFKSVVKGLSAGSALKLYDLRHGVIDAMKNSGMPHLDLTYLTSHATNDILNEYSSVDVEKSMGMYFASIPALLGSIATRAAELGIVEKQAGAVLPPRDCSR